MLVVVLLLLLLEGKNNFIRVSSNSLEIMCFPVYYLLNYYSFALGYIIGLGHRHISLLHTLSLQAD